MHHKVDNVELDNSVIDCTSFEFEKVGDLEEKSVEAEQPNLLKNTTNMEHGKENDLEDAPMNILSLPSPFQHRLKMKVDEVSLANSQLCLKNYW